MSEDLSPEIETHVDPDSGSTYFVNNKRRGSFWTLEEAVAASTEEVADEDIDAGEDKVGNAGGEGSPGAHEEVDNDDDDDDDDDDNDDDEDESSDDEGLPAGYLTRRRQSMIAVGTKLEEEDGGDENDEDNEDSEDESEDEDDEDGLPAGYLAQRRQIKEEQRPEDRQDEQQQDEQQQQQGEDQAIAAPAVEEMTDPDSGSTYFVSTDKKGRRQSFWTMEELKEVSAAEGPELQAGVEAWQEGDPRIEEAIDEQSGYPYFTDKKTGASFWTLEEAVAAVAAEGVVEEPVSKSAGAADVIDPIMVAAMKIMKEKEDVRRKSLDAAAAATVAAAAEAIRSENVKAMAAGGAGPMGSSDDDDSEVDAETARLAAEALEAEQIADMMKEFILEQGAEPGSVEAEAADLRRQIEEAEAAAEEAGGETEYDEVLTGKALKSAARTSRLGVELSGVQSKMVKMHLKKTQEHAKSGFMQKCGPKGPDDFRRRFFHLNLETRELICTVVNPSEREGGQSSVESESNQWIMSPEKGMQRVQKGDMITKEKAKEAKLTIPLDGAIVRVRGKKALFHEFEICEGELGSARGLISPTQGNLKSPTKKQGRQHVLRADTEKELIDWMVLLKKGTRQDSLARSPAATSPTGGLATPSILSPTGSSGGSPAPQRRVSFSEAPEELGKVLTAEDVRAEAVALVADEVYEEWKEKMKLGNLSVIIYTKDGRSNAEVITVDSIRGTPCLTWGGRLTSTGFLNKGNSMNLSNATHLALMERAGGKIRNKGRIGGKALPLVGAKAELWGRGVKCSREQAKAALGHEVRGMLL
jgi:hypothetical protein